MSDQITLRMPCGGCEAPCDWPFDGPKGITCLQQQLVNNSCQQCIALNALYPMSFFQKIEFPAGFICVYENEFFLPTCTINRAVLVANVIPFNQQLTLTFILESTVGFATFTWQKSFQAPESQGDGPFALPFLNGLTNLCMVIPTVDVIVTLT